MTRSSTISLVSPAKTAATTGGSHPVMTTPQSPTTARMALLTSRSRSLCLLAILLAGNCLQEQQRMRLRDLMPTRDHRPGSKFFLWRALGLRSSAPRPFPCQLCLGGLAKLLAVDRYIQLRKTMPRPLRLLIHLILGVGLGHPL